MIKAVIIAPPIPVLASITT